MVQVFSESFECKVSATRMWHGLFKDAHNCLPKALPFKVVGVEYPHGQHGFELPGAERLIKFHKVVSDKVEQLVDKEEGLAKGEAEKVGEVVQKESKLVKEKSEEAVGAAHKEACGVKEKIDEVDGAADAEAHHIKKEVGGAVDKGSHFMKEKVGSATYAAVNMPKRVLHKEEEEAHKALEIAEKVVHKEEEEVHKVGDFLKHEELWIKEKIEEVDHEALKITISVLEGGLIGILFKHCKHTFELKDSSHGGAHGSILHWTSEFEALPSAGAHLHHSFDKLEKHALETFQGVEAYLLKHDDYAC